MPEKRSRMHRSHASLEEERQHPRVGALPESQINETWYWAIEISYAWIAGFRPYLYWQNTTNCINRFTNFTFHEIDWFMGNISLPESEINTYAKIDKSLFLVQNFTVHVWYCNSAWQ